MRRAPPQATETHDIRALNSELLSQVYKLVEADIALLARANTLSESQTRRLQSHGRFLLDSSKELRIAETEALGKAKKMTDPELVEALRALPKESLHKILTLLAQEKENGS
jgi:ribosome-binding ATPase YchF (GTP1/OBG family)